MARRYVYCLFGCHIDANRTDGKGQLISKCPLGVFKSPKKAKKVILKDF